MSMHLLENDSAIETRIRDFAQTLSEKDRRRFAAIEATQRGYGGIVYIAGVLGCSTKPLERGIKELDHLQDDPAAGRVRRPGAGRKKRLNWNSKIKFEKGLYETFLWYYKNQSFYDSFDKKDIIRRLGLKND